MNATDPIRLSLLAGARDDLRCAANLAAESIGLAQAGDTYGSVDALGSALHIAARAYFVLRGAHTGDGNLPLP